MGGIFGWEAEYPNIVQPGLPINSFYGYKTAGIYQNAQQIAADPMAVAANTSVPGSVQPGFFKYADLNHNGIRDAGDEASLGSYLPKVTYGFNISISLMIISTSALPHSWCGGSNKILNLNRGEFQKGHIVDHQPGSEIHGAPCGRVPDRPTRIPPRLPFRNRGNKEDGGNSFFVESGAYLRIQNIQLGYNFKVGTNAPIGLRVFVTADRPFIFTKYSGFTPEISGIGYDNQVYPVTKRPHSFGVKATFSIMTKKTFYAYV